MFFTFLQILSLTGTFLIILCDFLRIINYKSCKSTTACHVVLVGRPGKVIYFWYSLMTIILKLESTKYLFTFSVHLRIKINFHIYLFPILI